MNVRDYLRLVRRPYAIFTEDDCPSELDCVFKLYHDMLYHYDLQLDNPLSLVLTQSTPEFSTQFVTIGAPYIVLEMQDIQRISQVMEFFSLRDIDVSAPISYFHALWIEHHAQNEFIGRMELPSGKILKPSIMITSEAHLAYRSPLFDKLSKSKLLEPFSELEGFQAAFEIVPAFAIAHEIAHFQYARASSEERVDALTIITELSDAHQGGGYFLDLLQTPLPSAHLDEELYCDHWAIATAYDLCVARHWLDERLFCVVITQLFNALFYNLMLQGCTEKRRYDELRIRKGFGLLLALSCLANEEKAKDMYRDYERFLGLLDAYCISLCVTIMRATTPGFTPGHKAAVSDYLKVNLRNYASPALMKRPTIDGLLHEMSVFSRRFSSNKSLI